MTNLITEANQIKNEITRLRKDCRDEVNLLRSVVAEKGTTKSMETLTQRVYSSVKTHVDSILNHTHKVFADNIATLRKDNTISDGKIRRLSEKLEDTDNAVGILDGNIKHIEEEITDVDKWTTEHLRNIKIKLRDLKNETEELKQLQPNLPSRASTPYIYQPFNPPNIQQHPLVQAPALIAKDVKVPEPDKFDGSTDSLPI